MIFLAFIILLFLSCCYFLVISQHSSSLSFCFLLQISLDVDDALILHIV